MSRPTREPVEDQRVHPDSMPSVDLFSHPPKAEVIKWRSGLSGEGVDGRTVAFSGVQSRRVTDDDGARSGVPGTTRRPPR
jgi:hypothetical protein